MSLPGGKENGEPATGELSLLLNMYRWPPRPTPPATTRTLVSVIATPLGISLLPRSMVLITGLAESGSMLRSTTATFPWQVPPVLFWATQARCI